MEFEKEDTYYAEIHHLRMMIKLKDDRIKMYEVLVKDLKHEFEVLEIKLKNLANEKNELHT